MYIGTCKPENGAVGEVEEEEEEEREALLRIIKKAQSTIKTNRVFLLRCLFSSMWKFSPFLCGFRNAAAAAAGGPAGQEKSPIHSSSGVLAKLVSIHFILTVLVACFGQAAFFVDLCVALQSYVCCGFFSFE